MLKLVFAVLYALALAVPVSIGFGFLYYFLCVGLMCLLRRAFGEEHRGYYLLNVALLALVLTFFLVFAFFVRIF